MVRQRRSTLDNLLENVLENPEDDNVQNTPPRPPSSVDMHSSYRFAFNKPVISCLTLLAVLAWLFLSPHGTSSLSSLKGRSQPQLHLFLPASSANKNFCRLLLSAIILNYPVPVLINFGAKETDDPYDMHLLKIQTVLDYLEKFPENQQDDLVLMVDAYDVWFQLPPETIIRRYEEQVDIDRARLKERFGKQAVKENDFQQTVYFSNDKICWPDLEGKRPACWAVPPSPLVRDAYGPLDDSKFPAYEGWLNGYTRRARWLNSGSMIGPVKDMKKMFRAVAKYVKDHYEFNSDQYYFAQIWGNQEYARLLASPNRTLLKDDKHEKPDLAKDSGGRRSAEYHMSLDYENSMFQPIGYYDPFLSFLQFDGSIQSGRPKDAPIPYSDAFELAADIKETRPPLDLMPVPKAKVDGRKMRMKGWHELPLLTNLVTKHTIPVVHFMVEKQYRVKWWDRMWYAPFARDLFEASISAGNLPILSKPIKGKMWKNAELPVVKANVDAGGKRDGAWSDTGMWLSWNSLCLAHEEYIFTADRRESYTQS